MIVLHSGYTVLPYPLTDQPAHPGLQSEATDLSIATKEDTLLEEEEKPPETGTIQIGYNVCYKRP